jgi:hypothetical protein
MPILEEQVADAWRAASAALDLRFEAPFTLKTRAGQYSCIGWLADFGSPKGTILLLDIGSMYGSDAWRSAENEGYFVSALNGDMYRKYERSLFVETLRDWGYFGDPGRQPLWLPS